MEIGCKKAPFSAVVAQEPIVIDAWVLLGGRSMLGMIGIAGGV